ncbi:MAG TPA: cytochrome c [Candidatus Acidoferrales bacterium]|jgi:mono/diheme cytochrome c family protein|nr:cytochrome c [Candidatus Acidoferrales bacterium]
MRIKATSKILPLLFLCLLGPLCGRVAAQTPPDSGKGYEKLIYSVKGPDLFRAHCAACHGAGGKGDGPAASALKTKPADLTALAKNNSGKFPVERVRKFISGDDPSLSSHGSREMPVWGPIFHQIENDQDLGNVRLQNLIAYLETIQQK